MSTRNPSRPLRPRLVTVTLVPARMRSAYVETRCLMQRADGATAAAVEPDGRVTINRRRPPLRLALIPI